MKKNPFSLYDFLGYVFPGMLSLVLFHSAYSILGSMNGNHVAVTSKIISDYINSVTWDMGWENTVVFIIISYCVGHVIAYASSLTVEKMSIWLYGYPSAFIMGNPSFFNRLRTGAYWKDFIPCNKGFAAIWKRIAEVLWKLLTSFMVFPITACCTVLGYIFQVEKLYLKPIDGTLKQIIQSHTEKLMDVLGKNKDEVEVDFAKASSDFHRLIYNYEYEKQAAHRIKMDNYVALYGFLRALTFISNCIFMADVAYMICAKISFSEMWGQLFLLMGLTYLLFMAFMKFYRRFTMESFMCLSIDTKIQ